MSDVPTNGANNTQVSSQGLGQKNGAYGRDIEDIDRELEAYLEEKRSGKGVGYHHSVDEQLSQIREKFGARVTPTKESEKPKEVEVVRDTPSAYSARKEEKPHGQQLQEKKEVNTNNQNTPVLSHEELIRSLEEKYSRGESTNLPPKAPISNEKQPSASKEIPKAVSAEESNSTLVDLRESIQPLNQNRVDTLLRKAALLTKEEQKSLSETFLARFIRNKERMELYTKTQSALEDEFERFVLNVSTISPRPEEGNVPPKGAEAQTSPVAESPQKVSDAPAEQKTENTVVNTPPPAKEPSPVPEEGNSLERRYRSYLSKLEKKPLVLVYEPENGFVRKQVDPDDTTLTLTYSLESSTNTAVLTVYDTHGNELGVFRTPEKELDN